MRNGGYASEDVLVDAQWLADHLHDPALRVVEVDVNPKAYESGHLPGAVLWNIYRDLKDSDYRLVGNAGLQKLFSDSGITHGSTVVFHGYGPAGRPDTRQISGRAVLAVRHTRTGRPRGPHPLGREPNDRIAARRRRRLPGR